MRAGGRGATGAYCALARWEFVNDAPIRQRHSRRVLVVHFHSPLRQIYFSPATFLDTRKGKVLEMVHLRLNETESNPNPSINFITALPSLEDIQEESRQLLRALAAQVKPVMKSHGFSVNSFEEVRPSTRLQGGEQGGADMGHKSMNTTPFLRGGTGIMGRLSVSSNPILNRGMNPDILGAIELVLRRPGGEFYPTSWLMSTLCHEVRCPCPVKAPVLTLRTAGT